MHHPGTRCGGAAKACATMISAQRRWVSVTPGLERHADPQSAFPDHPAALSRGAVEHFKPLRKLDELQQLQARPAGRVVDQDAFNSRRLGAHEDLGDLGNPAFWPLACKQSRVLHDRTLHGFAILALVMTLSTAGA